MRFHSDNLGIWVSWLAMVSMAAALRDIGFVEGSTFWLGWTIGGILVFSSFAIFLIIKMPLWTFEKKRGDSV